MILGVTATRQTITKKQEQLFEEKVIELNITSFRHGDCLGGDKQAHEIVRRLGNIYIIVHPPLNSFKRAYCKGDVILKPKKYLERNKDIINLSDYMIAMPNSTKQKVRSGTWYTVRYARKVRKALLIIFPNGLCESF